MKLEEFKKKAKDMTFLTKSELRMLEPNKHTLDLNLKYWMKSGEIIQLKRGMYILKDRWERERDIDGYREYLANQMMRPSYLSGEYVMQAHALLTEAVYGVSSVTVKKTVAFSNPLGHFQYYSITPTLFTGYAVKRFGGAPVLVASKSKALFDFLYLRFLKRAAINETAIEELRIHWELVSKKEFREVASYAAMSKRRNIKSVMGIIRSLYYQA